MCLALLIDRLRPLRCKCDFQQQRQGPCGSPPRRGRNGDQKEGPRRKRGQSPGQHPGVEQKATWLQIRQNRPDYVLLWGWGVMNSTAIKEAVAVGYPRENPSAHLRAIQGARGFEEVPL